MSRCTIAFHFGRLLGRGFTRPSTSMSPLWMWHNADAKLLKAVQINRSGICFLIARCRLIRSHLRIVKTISSRTSKRYWIRRHLTYKVPWPQYSTKINPSGGLRLRYESTITMQYRLLTWFKMFTSCWAYPFSISSAENRFLIASLSVALSRTRKMPLWHPPPARNFLTVSQRSFAAAFLAVRWFMLD